METNISPISPNLFYCDFCLIKCNRKTEWDRHIKTKKHIGNQKETSGNQNFTESFFDAF